MSNARELAREARSEPAPPATIDPLTENRLRDLEAANHELHAKLAKAIEATSEAFEILADKIDKVERRAHANEMSISKNTIEKLARAQVARIMREEAPKK